MWPEKTGSDTRAENGSADDRSKEEKAPRPTRSGGVGQAPTPQVGQELDVVEAALAEALSKAAAAAQWTTVEVLSRELAARREAKASVVPPAGVVPLDVERQKRSR
jgi:hypothetical protein